MLVLAVILGLIVACVLPALVIGFSAETAPPEPARKPVLPVARGLAMDETTVPEAPPEPIKRPAPDAPTAPHAPATDAPTSDAGGELESGTVYVTRTGERYHQATCPHLRESRMSMGLTEARAQGLKPCQACGG